MGPYYAIHKLICFVKRRVDLNQLLLKDFEKVIEKWVKVPLELSGWLVFIGCAEQHMQASLPALFINIYSLPCQAWHVVISSTVVLSGFHLSVVFDDGGR